VTSKAFSVAAFLLYALTLGFLAPIEAEDVILGPEKAAEVRRIIFRWLECGSCTEADLKAVENLRELAVPSLNASLRGGPSEASRESLRRHLMTTYREMKQYKETHPETNVSMSEEQYLETYMGNYDAQYRIRSARALAAIGGDQAKKALVQALQQSYREDVMRAVKTSLAKLKDGTSP
jgi:HEAT repeat protein